MKITNDATEKGPFVGVCSVDVEAYQPPNVSIECESPIHDSTLKSQTGLTILTTLKLGLCAHTSYSISWSARGEDKKSGAR